MEQWQSRYKSAKHYENEQQKRKYFFKVIEAYIQALETQPLVARNYDPQARSQKRFVIHALYIADVESATKRILKGKLFDSWRALVFHRFDPAIYPPVASEVESHIVRRCIPLYRSRGLAPYDYFRTIKRRRGSKESNAEAQ